MTAYIALLRGINVGGHKMIAMADLRDFLTELGLADARTLLNSGNAVFRAQETTPEALERRLEAEAMRRLSLDSRFFVRSAEEWTKVIAGNPLQEEAKRDPGHLLVLCMKAAPNAAAVKALEAAIVGREVVRVAGRHAYVHYVDGAGTSKLTNAVIEKKLGTSVTGRNWNTVLKLAAAAGVGAGTGSAERL